MEGTFWVLAEADWPTKGWLEFIWSPDLVLLVLLLEVTGVIGPPPPVVVRSRVGEGGELDPCESFVRFFLRKPNEGMGAAVGVGGGAACSEQAAKLPAEYKRRYGGSGAAGRSRATGYWALC